MARYHGNPLSFSVTPSAPPSEENEFEGENIVASAPPAYDDEHDENIECLIAPPAYDQEQYPLSLRCYTFNPEKIYNDLPGTPPANQAIIYSEIVPQRARHYSMGGGNFSPVIINAGNYYDRRPDHRPQPEADKIMSRNGAIWYGFLISLGTLTLAPYGIRATFKALKNLFKFKRPLNTLWRLYMIGVGMTIGLLEGAALGAAIGTAIPGLGTAAGAMIGLICCPLIGAGIGALAGKYSAKLVSWLNAREESDVSSTNHGKWKMSERSKRHIEDHIREYKPNSLRSNTLSNIMSRLRNQKNALGKRAYIPFSDDCRARELGNQTLHLMKSDVPPLRDGKYLFWNTCESEKVLALDMENNQWMEGRVSVQRI